MQKRNRNVADLRKRLGEFAEREGLNQAGLAKILSISQPHLSRILSNKVPLSRKIARRAEQLFIFDGKGNMVQSDLEGAVLDAIKDSHAFANLVSAALELLNKNA